MWRNQMIKSIATNLLQNESLLVQPSRNTFILKRRYPLKLYKKNSRPHPLKGKDYIYDVVEDTEMKPLQKLDIILTSHVEGIGSAGEVLSLKPHFAYNKLLLPKLAVYASPENLEKYKHLASKIDKTDVYSSPFVYRTIKVLSKHVFAVVMNKEEPWVIEPWHIQIALRKGGIECPLEAIKIPEQPIKGPDMNLQNKEFNVVVTINNKEKVDVKCRIHHWSTEQKDRLPYVFEHWKLPAEKLFDNVAQ